MNAVRAMQAASEASDRSANALERLASLLAQGDRTLPKTCVSGAVTEIATTHYRVAGLSRFVRLGECVRLDVGDRSQIGEVVRIEDVAITLKPFDSRCDTAIGARAYRAESLTLWPHDEWKGRVIDALGRPIDDGGELKQGDRCLPLDSEPPPALRRARVRTPIKTGIRVIDLFTPLCAGQRIGVFAGSGVGKSSLLGMLARAPDFDVVVIALVGERGREVREFLDDTLGENRRSAVAIVSTGDESPMMRRLAPKTAMTVAEYFRDRGQSVLLIVDSVTRFAHAARDVALAAGEPAVARGYAPSVFSDLPRLLERAGPGTRGRRRHHRRLLGAGGRRRPQRPGRGQHSRYARRPYRARSRDRRSGPISRGQYSVVDLAALAAALDPGAGRAGRPIEIADRPFRGDPGASPDGRIYPRRRSGAGSGGEDRAAHL